MMPSMMNSHLGFKVSEAATVPQRISSPETFESSSAIRMADSESDAIIVSALQRLPSGASPTFRRKLLLGYRMRPPWRSAPLAGYMGTWEIVSVALKDFD